MPNRDRHMTGASGMFAEWMKDDTLSCYNNGADVKIIPRGTSKECNFLHSTHHRWWHPLVGRHLRPVAPEAIRWELHEAPWEAVTATPRSSFTNFSSPPFPCPHGCGHYGLSVHTAARCKWWMQNPPNTRLNIFPKTIWVKDTFSKPSIKL